MTDQLAPGELERVLGGWIGIADAELVAQQYDRGGQQFQARIRDGMCFDGGNVRLKHRVPPKRSSDDSSKFRARTARARRKAKPPRLQGAARATLALPAHIADPTVSVMMAAPRSDVLLQRGQPLARRLDVLLVKADRLPQFGEPIGVFLGVLLFVGQRRRRAVPVRRA